MKNFLILVFLFLSATSFAIRHVGNGGGDAEMKVLSYASSMQSWLDYCGLDQIECLHGVDHSEYNKLKQLFDSLSIYAIKFVKKEDFLKRIEISNEGHTLLVFTNDELYQDAKTAHSDIKLFQIFISVIFDSLNLKNIINEQDIVKIPETKRHPTYDLFHIKTGTKEDLFAVDSKGVVQKLIPNEKTDLQRFTVLSETASGYIVKSLSSGQMYEIIVVVQNGSFVVKIFVFNDY